MRAGLGYLLGAAVSFTGGLADLAYINLRLVPGVLAPEVEQVVRMPPVEVAEVPPAPPPVAAPVPAPVRPPVAPVFAQAAVIHFHTESAELDRQARTAIAGVASRVRDDPSQRVRTAGYADARGPTSFNQALSERRAVAVANELVRLGVAADRVESHGFGEQTSSGGQWFLDRRVEISIGRQTGGP